MALDANTRLLRSVQRLGSAFARLERAAATAGAVTVPQLRLLHELQSCSDGGVTVGELAEQQGVAISTMTRNLAVLERAGLLARTPGEADRRTVRVALTAAGEARAAAVLTATLALLGDALAGFHPSDRIERAVALERVAAALERIT